jgi:hypothetical protein
MQSKGWCISLRSAHCGPSRNIFAKAEAPGRLICSHLNSIDTAVSCRSNDDAGEVKLRKFSKQRLSELPLDSPKCVVT